MSTCRTDQLWAGDRVEIPGIGPRQIAGITLERPHRWTVTFTNGAASHDVPASLLWTVTQPATQETAQ